jgi:translation initiation factor 1
MELMNAAKPPRGIVYTTGVGRVCPECGRPIASCQCAAMRAQAAAASTPGAPAGDHTVRLRRDRQDRRGKTVTVLEGLPLTAERLADLASELKRKCGAGGSVVGAAIEIQGDHVERLEEELVRRGYRVKRVGG